VHSCLNLDFGNFKSKVEVVLPIFASYILVYIYSDIGNFESKVEVVLSIFALSILVYIYSDIGHFESKVEVLSYFRFVHSCVHLLLYWQL